MNDQPRNPELDDDQALAVSAVLDGTADDAQRALVDASPELRSWIDSYRATAAEMADIEVTATARESAIAAALAVFDELQATSADAAAATVAPVAPVAPVLSLADRARRRWNPRAVLGAAAAIVAVLAIGTVIANTGGSDDDSSTAGNESAATTAALVTSQKDQTEIAAATEAPDEDASGAAPAAPIQPSQTIGEIPGAADPISNPATADAAPADTQGADATEAPSAETTGQSTFATSMPPAEPVADPPSLADYARRVEAEREGGTATTVPTSSCAAPDDEVLGNVLYGPDEVFAIVIHDVGTDEVRAVAADTCQVLASVTP